MKEPDRVRFARDLKSALGAGASKWDHADAEEESQPLGRYRTDLSESDRIDMVSHPAKLVAFFEEGFKELFELVPMIDETLKKYRDATVKN